jgi:hypothetical protein
VKHPIIINSEGKVNQIPKLGIIARYLASTQGRNKLAQAMVNPIRNRMDYNSLARKMFLVEQLPEKTMFLHWKNTIIKVFLLDLTVKLKSQLLIQKDCAVRQYCLDLK